MSNKEKFKVFVAWVGAIAQVTAVIIIVATALWLVSFISKGA
jgi:hypothetical protein